MPSINMSGHELTNTDVDFVALVKRGANRLPFRITKGDDEMIDLNAIGRRMFKKADAAPTVIAIVARKEDAQSPAVQAVAKACDLDLTKLAKSEDDALVTFMKKDAPTQGGLLMKLDKDVAVTVTGSNLRKGFENFDFAGTVFEGLDGSKGFCVGPAVAATLHKSAIDGFASDTSVTTLQSRLSKANDAFSAYFSVLSAYAPASVIKADQLLKVGTGNADGGAGINQETGDGLGDQANTKTAKADAGKNGSGAGAELGQGSGTNAAATADDAANTEVDAKPGARVSGDDSGLDPKLKASTQKAADQKQLDDDSTTGAQSDVPAKLKAPTKKEGDCTDKEMQARKMKKAELVTVAVNALIKALNFDPDKDGDDDTIMTGESPAGEGAAQAPSDSTGATARASADDNANAGGDVTGKVKGKTLDLTGVPAKLQAPTQKNDGDADIGKKGKGNQLDDQTSGSGAQEKDVQTLKSADPIMQALASLAKSVRESNAAVTKTVDALAQRVDSVAALAKKTDAALSGTVFNEEDGDRSPARARKSDDRSGGIPLLDTGLSRRRA